MSAVLAVDRMTLGTSRLGTRPGDPEAAELAAAMVRSPFQQIDTSNAYAEGRSEALLGAARRGLGEAAARLTIFSKADADPVTGVFDGDRVHRSFAETVDRLGVAYLPVYHLHDPYGITLAQALARGGAVEALVALREEGLVGAIGIAAGTRSLVEDYIRTDAFDAVLTHNRYTLVDRSASSIIEAAKSRGMLVFNAAPFGGGMLAGSVARRGQYAYRTAPPELLAYVDRIAALCREWKVPLPAAALHFCLAADGVDSTVVGISRPGQLGELAALVEHPVPAGLLAAIEALGSPPGNIND
jgi:D-threo-aldose 1-dehydrogenase